MISKTNNKKILPLGFIFAFFVLVMLVALFLFFVSSPDSKDEIKLVDVEVNSHNTEIFVALAGAGIVDVFVDATPEKTTVIYSLPESIKKEESWYYIFGAVAGIYPETQKIIVQAYVGGIATEQIEAKTSDVLDFIEKKVPEKDFLETIIIDSDT